MGPLLVLVSPCFRGNVVVTACRIQKNVIVSFFFEIKFQNGAHFEKKKGYF